VYGQGTEELTKNAGMPVNLFAAPQVERSALSSANLSVIRRPLYLQCDRYIDRFSEIPVKISVS
jgi:hypothetical protein